VQCAFNLSTQLGFTNVTKSFTGTRGLENEDPVLLRSQFQAIYIGPDLGAGDYASLQNMVMPGGVIEQFVSLGGVAVINAAGTLGDQADIAPDGVGFASVAQHNSETIVDGTHPYFTGLGFGGELLSGSAFNGWQPTDYGVLTNLENLPVTATVLLTNTDGPSAAEYQHGDGKVIVTTLSYCWIGRPNSDTAAARNLLRYSRFYFGAAFTPAATVTPTATFTQTPTRTITPTSNITATPSPTPTLPALLGDVNNDGVVDDSDFASLIEAIYLGSNPPAADINGDGFVTAADLVAWLLLMP